MVEDDEWSWDDRFILNKVPQKNFVSDATRTELIISEDPEILSIQPQHVRVIILSAKDFEKSFARWNETEDYIEFSPFLKIDNLENSFILHKNSALSSTTYLIKKKAKGWVYKVIGGAVD